MGDRIKSIRINGYETHETPSRYVAYLICATWSDGQKIVSRRYSEFDAFHKTMMKTYPAYSRPREAILPPKVTLGTFMLHDGSIPKSRQIKLEEYLQAIVSAQDHVWSNSPEFLEFIGLGSDTNSEDSPQAQKTRFPQGNASQVAYDKWLAKSKELSNELEEIATLAGGDNIDDINSSLLKRLSAAEEVLSELESSFENLQAQELALLDKGLRHVSNYNLRYIKYTAALQNFKKRLGVVAGLLERSHSPLSSQVLQQPTCNEPEALDPVQKPQITCSTPLNHTKEDTKTKGDCCSLRDDPKSHNNLPLNFPNSRKLENTGEYTDILFLLFTTLPT